MKHLLYEIHYLLKTHFALLRISCTIQTGQTKFLDGYHTLRLYVSSIPLHSYSAEIFEFQALHSGGISHFVSAFCLMCLPFVHDIYRVSQKNENY